MGMLRNLIHSILLIATIRADCSNMCNGALPSGIGGFPPMLPSSPNMQLCNCMPGPATPGGYNPVTGQPTFQPGDPTMVRPQQPVMKEPKTMCSSTVYIDCDTVYPGQEKYPEVDG